MKTLLMSLFLLMASTAFAGPGGSDVGNGGDVVACRDQQGNLQSVESLDVFEWNKMNSNIPVAVFAGLSSDQIIDRVFKKIETQIPSLVTMLSV